MIDELPVISQLLQPQTLHWQSGGVRASLKARFALRDGRTQLVHSQCEAPLKIAKTFPRDDESGALDVCVMDVSPGFLSGDVYELKWHLERGTRVLARTQSFGRAHQMPRGKAMQNTRVTVSENALLHLAPQPLLLYRDADFINCLNVEIARGGAFISSEIMCAGRVARGELFEFRRYENRVEVTCDGALCFCSRNVFVPQEDESWHRAAWREYSHLGTLLAFGESLNEEVLEEVRALLREYFDGPCAASSLQNGIVVSVLGTRAWTMQKLFAEIARRLERTLCMKPT